MEVAKAEMSLFFFFFFSAQTRLGGGGGEKGTFLRGLDI